MTSRPQSPSPSYLSSPPRSPLLQANSPLTPDPSHGTPLPQYGFSDELDFDALIESNHFLFRVYTPKEPFLPPVTASTSSTPYFLGAKFDSRYVPTPSTPLSPSSISPYWDPVSRGGSVSKIATYADGVQYMDWTTRSKSPYISTSFSFIWSIWEALRRYHKEMKQDIQIAVVDARTLVGTGVVAAHLLQMGDQQEENYWRWLRWAQESQAALIYGSIPASSVLSSIPLFEILRKLPGYFLRPGVSHEPSNLLHAVAWDYTGARIGNSGSHRSKKVSYTVFCQQMSTIFLNSSPEIRLRDTTTGSVRLAAAFLRPWVERCAFDDFEGTTDRVRELAFLIAQWPGQWWARDHKEMWDLIRSMALTLTEEIGRSTMHQLYQQKSIDHLEGMVRLYQERIAAASPAISRTSSPRGSVIIEMNPFLQAPQPQQQQQPQQMQTTPSQEPEGSPAAIPLTPGNLHSHIPHILSPIAESPAELRSPLESPSLQPVASIPFNMSDPVMATTGDSNSDSNNTSITSHISAPLSPSPESVLEPAPGPLPAVLSSSALFSATTMFSPAVTDSSSPSSAGSEFGVIFSPDRRDRPRTISQLLWSDKPVFVPPPSSAANHGFASAVESRESGFEPFGMHPMTVGMGTISAALLQQQQNMQPPKPSGRPLSVVTIGLRARANSTARPDSALIPTSPRGERTRATTEPARQAAAIANAIANAGASTERPSSSSAGPTTLQPSLSSVKIEAPIRLSAFFPIPEADELPSPDVSSPPSELPSPLPDLANLSLPISPPTASYRPLQPLIIPTSPVGTAALLAQEGEISDVEVDSISVEEPSTQAGNDHEEQQEEKNVAGLGPESPVSSEGPRTPGAGATGASLATQQQQRPGPVHHDVGVKIQVEEERQSQLEAVISPTLVPLPTEIEMVLERERTSSLSSTHSDATSRFTSPLKTPQQVPVQLSNDDSESEDEGCDTSSSAYSQDSTTDPALSMTLVDAAASIPPPLSSSFGSPKTSVLKSRDASSMTGLLMAGNRLQRRPLVDAHRAEDEATDSDSEEVEVNSEGADETLVGDYSRRERGSRDFYVDEVSIQIKELAAMGEEKLSGRSRAGSSNLKTRWSAVGAVLEEGEEQSGEDEGVDYSKVPNPRKSWQHKSKFPSTSSETVVDPASPRPTHIRFQSQASVLTNDSSYTRIGGGDESAPPLLEGSERNTGAQGNNWDDITLYETEGEFPPVPQTDGATPKRPRSGLPSAPQDKRDLEPDELSAWAPETALTSTPSVKRRIRRKETRRGPNATVESDRDEKNKDANQSRSTAAERSAPAPANTNDTAAPVLLERSSSNSSSTPGTTLGVLVTGIFIGAVMTFFMFTSQRSRPLMNHLT